MLDGDLAFSFNGDLVFRVYKAMLLHELVIFRLNW